MDVLITRCAGLDVHKKEVTACVRTPGDGTTRHQEIRRFGTTTRQLAQLRMLLRHSQRAVQFVERSLFLIRAF